MTTPTASARQRRRAAAAFSIEELRQQSRKRLPRGIFDFYDGGSEDESTLRANLQQFSQHRFVPKYLVDVSNIDTSCDILGTRAPLPIAISPTGAIGYGWPRGEIAIARAARDAGIPYSLPTSATTSIEQLAQAVPDGRLWFQAYMLRKRDFTMGLIERARKAGYEALIITVDMPTGGKRERDLRNEFGLPFRFTPRNVLDFALHPGWVARLLRNGMPVLENMKGFVPDNISTSAIASSVGKNYDPAFCWDDLARIRDQWPGRLMIKGLLHPEDAQKAQGQGFDGIIISNHGGRQLDGAIGTLEALPAIRRAVGDTMQLLLDGGVRRGADVLKAIALGANAVMVGRPILYGVSVAGQAGVERALFLLNDELTRAMRLSGIAKVADINRELLGRPAP